MTGFRTLLYKELLRFWKVATQTITAPMLDDCVELDGAKATPICGPAPRLAQEGLGHRDWHNDLSRLVLDIDDAIRKAGDEKARGVIIRRLRRALEGQN